MKHATASGSQGRPPANAPMFALTSTDHGAGSSSGAGKRSAPRQMMPTEHEQVTLPIVVIDDRAFTRDCLTRCLRNSYVGTPVLAYASTRECLHAAPPASLSFVLYNVHQSRASDADVERGIEQLRASFGESPIVLMSDGDGADRILEALERGARGYIPTDATIDVAVSATRVVRAGGTFVPASGFRTVPEARRPAPLSALSAMFTQRQFAVLQRMRQGMANGAIARELGMSEGTVKAHVRNIMQKLKATNRTQVVFLTREIFGDTPS